MTISKINLILWLALVIPYLCLIPAYLWYQRTLNNIKHSTFIIINKQEMFLYHYNYKGELLQKSKIACGKKFGNKENIGDNKTPEGVFGIGEIENASTWAHDFKDGNGEINGAYGPYFIRLNVPNQKGIGIHGTHAPNSIGSRASEGCIRMHNDELINLVNSINTASVVVITPSQSDIDSTLFEKIVKQEVIRPKKKE